MVSGFKALVGQDIFLISNDNLAGLDNIALGLLSPSAITFITALVPLQQLYFDDAYITDNTIQIQLNVPTPPTEYTVTGKALQSILDLCIMNYANLDKAYIMIQDNPNIVSVNDINSQLKIIKFDSKNLVNGYVVEAIKNKMYDFATLYLFGPNRITEDGIDRITESSEIRIIE